MKSLRVLHLCHDDSQLGGAAAGARRLHRSMLAQGIDSRLAVVEKHSTGDDRIVQIPRSRWRRRLIHYINSFLILLTPGQNAIYRSINLVNTGAGRFVNSQEVDIVQMHWVGGDTISIGEIASIKKPLVWKLPDMWAFSGTRHYSAISESQRYKDGFSASNRPDGETGLDLDKWIWRYKNRAWRKKKISIVGPSRWITDCAADSLLFRNNRCRHILNPLDLEIYSRRSKDACRTKFGLPLGKQLIMFGAMHATTDTRKGFHYLPPALESLAKIVDPSEINLVVLGADGPTDSTTSGFDTHYLGVIQNDEDLVTAYNTADVFVLPAELDNLPNVVKEATCCGVPCVGFRVGGMLDMIDHQETGYLAVPYETEDLGRGIKWAIDNCGLELNRLVRERAASRHDPGVVVDQYLSLYREILSEEGGI